MPSRENSLLPSLQSLLLKLCAYLFKRISCLFEIALIKVHLGRQSSVPDAMKFERWDKAFVLVHTLVNETIQVISITTVSNNRESHVDHLCCQ